MGRNQVGAWSFWINLGPFFEKNGLLGDKLGLFNEKLALFGEKMGPFYADLENYITFS
jgi:hypothetical protein